MAFALYLRKQKLNMKKTIQVAVAGIALIFAAQITSCKKDKKEEASLVGTWQSKSLWSNIKENGVVIFDTTMNLTNGTLVVNSDKTFISTDAVDASNNSSGTYSTSGSKLYLDNKDGTKDTMDYTVSATELSVSNSGSYSADGAAYEYIQKSTFTRK